MMQEAEFTRRLMTTYTDPELRHIINGALLRANVSTSHPDREDMEQEARLALVTGMEAFDRTHQDEAGRYAYLYTRLLWRIRDLQRRRFRHDNRQAYSLDEEGVGDLPNQTSTKPFLDRERAQLWHQLFAELTDLQFAYLHLCLADYRDKEIATKLGLTKQGVANVKHRVVVRARQVFGLGELEGEGKCGKMNKEN